MKVNQSGLQIINKELLPEITAIPDTTVSLAFSNRKAESGIDTSEDFHKPNDLNKGIYVVDIKMRVQRIGNKSLTTKFQMQ